MGTHCLDLLEWIMGTKAVEVCGFEDLRTHGYPTRVEDASTVLLRFASDHAQPHGGLLDDTAFVDQSIHCALLLRADGSVAAVTRVSDKTNQRIVQVAKLPPRNSAAIACLGTDTLGRVIPGFDPEAN